MLSFYRYILRISTTLHNHSSNRARCKLSLHSIQRFDSICTKLRQDLKNQRPRARKISKDGATVIPRICRANGTGSLDRRNPGRSVPEEDWSVNWFHPTVSTNVVHPTVYTNLFKSSCVVPLRGSIRARLWEDYVSCSPPQLAWKRPTLARPQWGRIRRPSALGKKRVHPVEI